jgi:hypothetical protein
LHQLGLLLIVVLFCSCGEAPKEEQQTVVQEVVDYSLWHTGKFYYKEPNIGTFLINRTDSIQEEFIKQSGMIVEFDIDWKNDSMYSLTFVKISENPNNKELAAGADSMVKQCTITNAFGLSYEERATSNLSKDTIYTVIYRQ